MEDDTKTGIQVEAVGKMACSKCATEFDVSPFESFTAVQCPQCGSRQTVPARLGHFVLLRLIGTGGMGGVYHARDETLGRDVAIKVMLKSLGDDVQFVETFRREAQAAAKLNHPSIAQIYSFGQAQGQPYIVMELVRQSSLAKMMEDSKQLGQSFVMDVGLQIAEGLQAADEIGLIHGDIKPENILMDERGKAKLVDFGLASFVDQAAAEGIWGTPYYIAPEKLKRQKADARSDIYSLGGTLYHAIAGQPPFEGKTPLEVIQARIDNAPPELAKVAEGTDKTVSGIVMRMLEEQPSRRYPTYASLISDLRRAVNSLPKPTKRPVTKRYRPTSKGRRIVTKKRPTETGGAVVGETPQTTAKLRIGKSTTTESALSDYRPPLTAAPPRKTDTKKTVGVVVAVIVGLMVLLGMAAGGIWFKQWRDERIAERTRVVLLGKASKEAQASADATYAAITNIMRTANAGRTAATQATNAVAETLKAALPHKSPTQAQKDDYAALRKLNETIVAAVADLDRMEGAIPKIQDAAGKALAKVVESDKVELARKRLESVQKVQEVTAKAETDAKDARTAIDKAAAEVKELCKKIDADWKRIQDERAAAEAAEEAEEKAKEEAARKAVRLKKELEMVKTARETQAVSRDTYRYSQAADDLQAQLSDYETPEGKQAMQLTIDRYRRLDDLKKAVIKKLAAAPYKWGWVSGRSPTDVLGADDNGVRLKGQSVPWDKVSTRQMLHFIKYLVGDRKIPLSRRGELTLSAAVFCRMHGGEELAKKYADSAASLSPRLEDEIARLLPPLPPAEE